MSVDVCETEVTESEKMEVKNCTEIVKAIRTLLTSAKNGLLTDEIDVDYEQMEGKQIPFKAMGYSTLEELLRDTNQFALVDTKQGIRVMSKPSKDGNAIKSAPNSPNKGKKKGNALPQRALRSTTDNQWNGTAYSQAYTQMPNRSVRKVFTHPAKALQMDNNGGNAVNTNSGPYRAILKQNIKHVPKDENPHSATDEATNWASQQSSKPFPMRSSQNQQRNLYQDRINKKPNEAAAAMPAVKSSVQSRLAIQKSISIEPIESFPETRASNGNDAVRPNYANGNLEKQMKSVKISDIEKMPYVQAVSAYCRQKGYAEPQYTFSRTKARKFTCKVTVGPAIYASYPHEFNTQVEAQTEAAHIAFESIKEIEYNEKYPVCMDSMAEIANKVLECISENGVFLKFIPQLFQEKYDQSVPDNWMSIIEDSPHLFSIAKDALMDRVYPNMPNSQKSDNGPSETKGNDLGDLKLPWNEKHWNIFVTSVSSTVDIWGRLIGPDYSAKLDSILDDIETELVSGGKKTVCTNLTVGKYAFITNPDCYRVRIEKIDANRKMALCFLIDYGDEEWWSLDQIYEGDAKLFELPAQAVRFSLFNLEDFAENPHAKQEVDEYLAGKTLIAEVKSTQAEYMAQCESSVDAKIKAVFYDTSSDEDLQLNKMILEKICEKVEPPQLQRSKWNPVCVSYISDGGDIYVQLYNDKGNTVHNIKQLIHRLTQNGISKQFIRTNGKAENELYLIQDNNDLKWYRAVILPKKSINSSAAATDDSIELCKYVDYGMTTFVPRENIYRLDLLSAALSKYPHQAIHVRLNDVTNYNAKIVARLRGLLCAGTPVLAQIANVTSMIPMVNICKRLENNILCKINDTIRMEQEIESSVDLLLDGEKTFAHKIGNSVGVQAKENADIRLYPEPPLNEFFNVLVVTAPSPSNFFVRPCKEEAEFKKMMLRLRDDCSNSNQIVSSADVYVDQYYAGLLQDGFWYRVKIQKVLPGDTVAVYKCDFGDMNLLSLDSMRPLGAEFRKIPQLAIPANLHGIQPKNNVWNNDDCAYFQQMTVQKQFATEIKAIRKGVDSPGYVLEMILIDVSTPKDININADLVANQHANYI